MKLHIENFAKIEKTDIEINGITVIAGENNTGKSTVGKVLYCLFDSFYNIVSKVNSQRKASIRNIVDDLGYYEDERDDFVYFIDIGSKDFDEMYNELVKKYEENNENVDSLIFLIEMILNEYCSSEYMKEQMDFNDVAKKIINVFSVSDDQIRKNLVLRSFNSEFSDDFYPKIKLEDDISSISLNIKTQSINLSFVSTTNGVIIDQIQRFLPLNTHVIYLDNPSIIDNMIYGRRYGLIRSNNHEFDLVRKLRIRNRKNAIDETILQEKIDFIKNGIVDIIRGSFVVENQQLKFKEEGFSAAHVISNLSTGIKSFAVLLRLLDNGYIEQGACVILDEPEVHLHPKWQLKYAELLVLLQQTLNLHILINSHSPYFIEAIEVFSKEYATIDKCKFYLSDLDERNVSYFKDVSNERNLIYEKLAQPYDELDKIIYGNKK